jgi:hypothetical protein
MIIANTTIVSAQRTHPGCLRKNHHEQQKDDKINHYQHYLNYKKNSQNWIL